MTNSGIKPASNPLITVAYCKNSTAKRLAQESNLQPFDYYVQLQNIHQLLRPIFVHLRFRAFFGILNFWLITAL